MKITGQHDKIVPTHIWYTQIHPFLGWNQPRPARELCVGMICIRQKL